jgi:hypothetical protein
MADTITVGGVPTATTASIDGHTYSVLFSEHLAEDMTLYLRAGVFDWDRETSGPPGAGNHSGQNGFFGVGGSLRVSQHLELRAEYQRFEVGQANVDGPVLSIVYRF